MNLSTNDLLAAIIALAAFVVSVVSAMISRTNVITTTISANRIEWIGSVRNLMFDFLKEYRKPDFKKQKLELISAHIMLYLNRKNKEQRQFVSVLQECLNYGYSDALYANLVNEAQEVLSSVWVKMKREAGIRRWHEVWITNRLKAEKKRKADKFENALFASEFTITNE